jgi:hypothetical protein
MIGQRAAPYRNQRRKAKRKRFAFRNLVKSEDQSLFRREDRQIDKRRSTAAISNSVDPVSDP